MGRLKSDVKLSQFQTDAVTIIAYTGIMPHRLKFRLVYNEKYENKSIEEILLETTEMRLVMSIGLRTFGDVIERWNTLSDDIMKIKGIGNATLKRFRTKFISYYYETLNDREKILFWKYALGRLKT